MRKIIIINLLMPALAEALMSADFTVSMAFFLSKLGRCALVRWLLPRSGSRWLIWPSAHSQPRRCSALFLSGRLGVWDLVFGT